MVLFITETETCNYQPPTRMNVCMCLTVYDQTQLLSVMLNEMKPVSPFWKQLKYYDILFQGEV